VNFFQTHIHPHQKDRLTFLGYWIISLIFWSFMMNISLIIVIVFSIVGHYIFSKPLAAFFFITKNFLKKNSNSKYLQIWRPFNILSNYYSKNLSDHFHNILIKKFVIQKKNYHNFKGSEKDTRAYSSAKKFCRLIYKRSSLKKNFVCDYGNSNSLTVKKIIDIFKKSINREIMYNFSSFKKDINIVSKNKNIDFINTKENTSKLLKNYFDNFVGLNEN
jgi:hypothetical protein